MTTLAKRMMPKPPEPPVRFWAKTTLDGQPGLSVRDHCINVGCVAEHLLRQLPSPVASLLPAGSQTLAALHDVGKMSPGFLRKCEHWRAKHETGEWIAEWAQRERNHAAVSQAILGEWLGKMRAGYAIAAGGHHGFFFHNGHEPPLGQGGRWGPKELADPAFADPRVELRRALLEVFGHDLPVLPLSKKQETLVVFLTGFMTFADWLGSNEAFFPLDPATYSEPLPLADAASRGRQRAAEVVGWLSWGRTEIRPSLTFSQLFPFGPKPIQKALFDLAAKPGLFIVEAPMGGGKTEAALAAAYHRWTATEPQRGLYFALPTQLTSERIFERLQSFLSKALAVSDLATLVHGSAWLRGERVLEIRPAAVGTGTHADEGAAAYARDARLWFASSRQALLAPFGAGTIDQALLGALPAKHCGLRLFGLAGKVVVLDEVHSYDNYTGALVDRLVSDLMRLNATVIVLSATLTARRKRDLLLSAGIAEQTLPAMAADDGYPMITALTRGAHGEPLAEVREVAWDEESRNIHLEHRNRDDSGIWEEACCAAAAGACVLIIRNTVASAQETWRQLKCQVTEGGPLVALLHSRFPRWRRDSLEDYWIAALGQKGPRPAGCLLVATQVVEQSVDIDADLLITDLAPTDLLFQRLGRLHRHRRCRPAGFQEPKVVLLHPELLSEMDEKQLKAAFGPSGFVYPPYVLWRSAQQWRHRVNVAIPQDIRPWLEATYASEDHTLEPAAAALFGEWTGKAETMGAVACRRASRLISSDQPDTEGIFTRWKGQPSAELLLVRGKPRPVPGSRDWEITALDGQVVVIPAFEWSLKAAKAMHQNLVRVPLYVVRAWIPANPDWLREYLDNAVVGIVQEDSRILPLSGEETAYALRWQTEAGVRIEKGASPQPEHYPADDPDDGWW